MRSRNIWPL